MPGSGHAGSGGASRAVILKAEEVVMKPPRLRFTGRRTTTAVAVTALSILMGVTTAFAQSVRHIPIAGRTRSVAWASSPTGIVVQAVAAALLALVVIGLGRLLRPGPYRRKGRRSFLEDPEMPMPVWTEPEADDRDPPEGP